MNMGAKLKNNYLVNTIKSTKINDYYFFLMENMELNNLKSFSENVIENCSELLCSYFIYQCLLGLQYMHSNLIVHRDIKLENILIDQNYKVKLADFSMSTQLKEKSKYPVNRSGTIPYLPPESFYNRIRSKSSSHSSNNSSTNFQTRNNMITSINKTHSTKRYLSVDSSLKKDIFSLGVVMYRLLFKEHPFNYEYKMDRETYGKIIKKSSLCFKGKKVVTSDCKSFLEGLLNHNLYKRFSIEDALNHAWIIKTQKIINSLIKKNVGKSKFSLIFLLNNYIFKEDIEQFKNNKIFLEQSTKDSEDKEKEKKTFIKLKRRRNDEIDNDYKVFN